MIFLLIVILMGFNIYFLYSMMARPSVPGGYNAPWQPARAEAPRDPRSPIP